MPSEISHSETEQLMPTPWWQSMAESAATFGLMVAFGAPVAAYTADVHLAAGAAIIGSVLFNAVWWKVVRGVPLSDVYTWLKPWVRG